MVALGGVALSLIGFSLTWLGERDDAERAFERAADQRMVEIQAHADHVIDAVNIVGGLFEASREVTSEEFNIFVKTQFN